MKKNRFLLLITLFLCFFVFSSNAKALPACDIENNYGSISVTYKPHVEIGDTNYGMSKISYWCYNGNMSVGSAAKSTCDNPSEKFYIQYNIARETSKDGGYVKNVKFTIYNNDGNAQCYINYDADKDYGEKGVFQFNFNLNKKEVKKIVASGTYYTGKKDKKFSEKTFNINKSGDGSGSDHTTIPGTTSTKIEGSVIGGGAPAGIGKASSKKTITEIGSGNSDIACDTIGDLFDEYWPYAMVIIPILLIIMMAIDFFKAMVANDADAIKKAGTNAVKRTIATVIALALPALLRMVFGLFGIDFCL